MKIRRVAAISLSYRDYDSFPQKLDEACRWVSLAAAQGAHLAVLPEAINNFRGDGPGNTRRMTAAEMALDDWQAACSTLLECAAEHRIALALPVLLREGGRILNCFYLVSADGAVLGRYVKMYPTAGELAEGVAPGDWARPVQWGDVRVGGAICFDMNFREVFERQRAAGAELFVCPSLFPGGSQVNYFAAATQRPVVVAYPAWSRIIDRLGREVAAGGYRHETLRFGFGAPVYTADINLDGAVFHFDRNQEKIEEIMRRYGRDVAVAFDQDNVRFSVESLSPRFSVRDVIEEFDLQPIDEYLRESRRAADEQRGHSL